MGKKVLYSMALASVLMLGACSSNSDLDGSNNNKDAAKTSYISVNINNVGAAPTGRASYDVGGEKYEDGVGIENAINKVRFYFFNADGTPYLLNNAGKAEAVNYMDVNFYKAGDDHDHTAETVTNTMLILNGESSLAPASMLAVVNPDAAGVKAGVPGDLLGEQSQRFSILRTSMQGSNWSDKKGFVMSNSVYKEAGVDVCSTQLGGRLYTNADDATKNPIDVYVERVLAKVTANANKDNGNWSQVNESTYKDTWKIKVGTLKLSQEEGGSKTVDVYAWIQGWGIADANGNAELCKQIKVADWTDATLGIKPWSSPDYHRCFWSNSSVVNNQNPLVNQNFNSYTNQFGSPMYAMPNTPDVPVVNPKTSKNNLTKVLVAAKLGYEDNGTWKAAEICEYKGQEFLGIDDVKKVLLKETGKYYVKETQADGNTTYSSLKPENFEFVTSSSYNTGLKDYQVVAQLKGVAELYRVADDMLANTDEDRETQYTRVSADEVNKELAQNPAEIRYDGDAYYYTPIKHLGTAGSLGEYGVVRNHSYQVTIDDIKGWGTPVFDPSKIIIPTIPSNDKSYLAAKVNVLSWRVVNSYVNLDQTKK